MQVVTFVLIIRSSSYQDIAIHVQTTANQTGLGNYVVCVKKKFVLLNVALLYVIISIMKSCDHVVQWLASAASTPRISGAITRPLYVHTHTTDRAYKLTITYAKFPTLVDYLFVCVTVTCFM